MAKIFLCAGLIVCVALAAALGHLTESAEERLPVVPPSPRRERLALHILFSLPSHPVGEAGQVPGSRFILVDAPEGIRRVAQPGDLLIVRLRLLKVPGTDWVRQWNDHQLVRDNETLLRTSGETGSYALCCGMIAGAPFLLGAAGAGIAVMVRGRRNLE